MDVCTRTCRLNRKAITNFKIKKGFSLFDTWYRYRINYRHNSFSSILLFGIALKKMRVQHNAIYKIWSY